MFEKVNPGHPDKRDYGDWDGHYEYRIDMTEYHND